MTVSEQHIAQLLAKRLATPLTAHEEATLLAWRNRSPENARRYEELVHLSSVQSLLRDYQEAFERSATVAPPAVDGVPERTAAVHRVHFLRKWGWAAAAIILILAGTVLYFQNAPMKPSRF